MTPDYLAQRLETEVKHFFREACLESVRGVHRSRHTTYKNQHLFTDSYDEILLEGLVGVIFKFYTSVSDRMQFWVCEED